MDADNFLKIVYFDENFVADYLQIIAGGEMKKTTELMKELDYQLYCNAPVSCTAVFTWLNHMRLLFTPKPRDHQTELNR